MAEQQRALVQGRRPCREGQQTETGRIRRRLEQCSCGSTVITKVSELEEIRMNGVHAYMSERHVLVI